MRYRRGNKKEHKVGKAIGKSVFKFLISNPPLLGIIIVIIIALIAYIVYSADYQMTQLLATYCSLSARTLDSKADFDKRLFFVSVDENGNSVITFGYRSEVEQEQAHQALVDAGVEDDSGTVTGGGTPVNKTGDYIEFTWPMTVYYLSNGGSLVESQCKGYYGLGVEFSGSKYINYSWNKTTLQYELWSKIHSSVDNSDIYPTYDGLPLTAMTPYFSSNDVGQVVIVEFSNGDEVPVLVVDSKGEGDPYPKYPNASAWDTDSRTTFIGHYYVDKQKLAITEFIANDGQGYAAFNRQFGTNLNAGCTVVRVTKGDVNYLR